MGSRSCPRASAAVVGFVFILMVMPGRAGADVCVTVDEARDTFTPRERAAAVLMLERQFELAGEHIVAPDCASPYVVSHVQLGTATIAASSDVACSWNSRNATTNLAIGITSGST